MGECIYGVDIEGEITPLDVRDAIIRCFHLAHQEILDAMNSKNEFRSLEEKKRFENIQIDTIISSIFDDIGENFNNPTKEGLLNVMNELAKFSAKYRKPDIIKRHYNEIMNLVNKL